MILPRRKYVCRNQIKIAHPAHSLDWNAEIERTHLLLIERGYWIQKRIQKDILDQNINILWIADLPVPMRESHYNVGVGRGGKGVGDLLRSLWQKHRAQLCMRGRLSICLLNLFSTPLLLLLEWKVLSFLDLVWQEWGEPTWLVRLGMPPTLRRTFLLWRSSCGESTMVYHGFIRLAWSIFSQLTDFSYCAIGQMFRQ